MTQPQIHAVRVTRSEEPEPIPTLRMTPFEHWRQFGDSTLTAKYHLCRSVLAGLRQSDDPRAAVRVAEWEYDLLGMTEEMRHRGLIRDVTIQLKPAMLFGETS